MPPKKKKKAFPGAQRGYATTSIIKEKQPVQEEQNHEGEPQPSLPQDHPHPTASEQVPVLPPADTTIATPSSTWEDETPLEPVTNLSKDFASIARAAALRVDQELSRDEHKRNDIARDRSIPQLKLGQDAEKDMVQFLKDRGVVDTFDWFGPESHEETSLPRLYATYLMMERLGFAASDIIDAMRAVGGHRASAVLDWLCLSLPAQNLPSGFSDKIEYENEQTLTVAPKPERNVENQAQQPVPAKDDAVSFSTQTPAVESSAAESSPAKTKIDASLKSWILNNAQDDDSDSDTPSDSPPAPPQPTPSEQYARLRLELEHLKAAASAAKRDKDAKAQKQAGARVREVNELLKALERAGCVDWKEEERVYRELNKGEVESGEKGAEVGEGVDVDVVGGGDVEGEVEGKGGDEVPGKDGGDGQAEPTVETPDANQDEQDDDGGFLGAMFTDPPPTSTSPSQPPASTSTTTPAPTIRDMSVTKWTGRTPKQLLQDWTSKNARGARISYFSIKGGAGDRAGVRFSGGKGKVAVDAVVVEMDAGERVKGRKDAEEFVATKALYHFASQLSLHRSLPPPFRDLWMEWVDAEKNAAEQTRQTIEEEGMQRILQLAEHRQKLIDERQAKTPTLTTSDPTPLSSQTDAASSTSDDETTRTAVSRALKDELQKRRSQSSYKELLNQRRSLPVYAMKDELVKLVNEHRVMIVSGETGSGKSTQIPQFLLETAIDGGSGGSCNPRRISATSIATRVSEEMGDGAGGGRVGSNGAWVGYQVRLESRVSKSTRLNFCTTGVLLRRLESDGHLHGVTHVVVDEVHERSLDSDFLVLLLRRILVRRADIKVILMSATADAQLFATYFAGVPGIGHVPCVEVPGRTFPVTTYYMEDAVEDTGYKIEPGSEYAIKASMRMRDAGNLTVSGKGGKKYTVRLRWEEVVDGADYDEDEDDDDTDQPQPDTEDPDSDSSLTPPPRTYSKSTHRTLALSDPRKINLDLVERVVRHIVQTSTDEENGSVLVFLPGLAEIRKLAERLEVNERGGRKGGSASGMWVVPLHSVLGSGEQGKVFRPAPKGLRKVVLATNIAETGITIPDVVYVVDTVRAREISYDERRNITRLSEVLISKANCKQRRGRAGRLRPGVCYHLVPREVYEQLPAHRPPEMLRLPLEELSLRIRATASAHGHTGPIADLLAQAPDPPPVKHVDRAVGLLKQIQALDASENVTVLGTRLADLPLDARLGKMLLYAVALRCLDPVLTICAALSLGKSPFARPFGRESEADRARMVFRTADSDLLTYATAFHRWRDLHLRQVPIPTIREFFDHHFLSAPNLTLIEEARTQLLRGLASNDTIALPHPPTPGGGSKRTVSFTPIPPLYNTHADATSTVLTAISAGLYPNVLIRDATPPTEKAGGGLHAPGRSDTVRLHTSSVLHGETVKPGWFVCHGVRAAPPGGAQGKAKAIAWDVNRTTGIGLLGVAVGNLDVQHRLRTVSPTDAASNTANKLIARCSPRTAAAVAAFGRELHAVLERRMSTKDGAGGNADADEEVVRLFLKLVEDEAKNWVPNR